MINKKFKYVVEGSPIDWFYLTMTKDGLIDSVQKQAEFDSFLDLNKFIDELNINYKFINDVVNELSGEKPYIIRYFGIPEYDCYDMELCALAKIDNNGTTYMFTNNKEFAKLISNKCGYNFDVKHL